MIMRRIRAICAMLLTIAMCLSGYLRELLKLGSRYSGPAKDSTHHDENLGGKMQWMLNDGAGLIHIFVIT